MRGIAESTVGRLCSLTLALVLVAGPVFQAGPAFASEDRSASQAPSGESAAAEGASADASPTVVRELTEKRSENVSQYLLSDGTIRAQITGVPTRFEDADGEWVDIDTSLVPSSETGAVETAATSATVTFDAQEPAETPVTLAGDGFEVGIDMLGVGENARLVVGDSARYLNVAPDADLEYQATRTGVKETVVLKSAAAPSTFQFRLELDGLTIRKSPLGSYGLYGDQSGQCIFDLGELVVFDSSEDEAGEPAYCTDATMTVTQDGVGDALVTYVVPEEWLSDPDRVFPVMVDPTLEGNTNGQDTYAGNDAPTATHGGSEILKCGYRSNDGRNRSFLRFFWSDSDIPAGAYVRSGELRVFVDSQHSGSASGNHVDIGRLSQPFSSGTTNWNNMPTDYTWIGSPSSVGKTGQNIVFEAGPTVQAWVSDYSTNYGFTLYQHDTSAENTTYYKQFCSSNHPMTTRVPQLVVTYSNPAVGGSGVDKSVYRVGDTVTATIKVGTGLPGDVNCIEAKLRGTTATGSQTKGYFQWTKTAPGSGWSDSHSNPAGTGGGFVSAKALSGVDFLKTECEENVPDSGTTAEVKFRWRVREDYGDVQDNDIDVVIRMDPVDRNESSNRWSTDPAKVVDTNFDIMPAQTGQVGATTTSSGWFTEPDTNGDLIADGGNDTTNQGRGSVQLSWGAAARADSYRVYLHDGNAFRQVGTTTATSWSSAGQNLYPTDSAIAALAANYTGNPYQGASRDLRDDPNALYRKTAGTALDDRHDYLFKVVPYDNYAGELPISEVETLAVVLPNRTLHANDDPRHTTHDFEEVLGHDVAAELDTGTLELDVTDLSIDWWGPAAELSRHYSSGSTAGATWAPGWRFNFEQSVTQSGSIATYTDETGEQHRFANVSGTWVGPKGFYGTLAKPGDWTLSFRDGSSLVFDGGATGRLKSEADPNGNQTAYTPEGDNLRISAGNGHSILVVRDASGVVSSASYSTTAGTRSVAYTGGTTPRVTYSFGTGDSANRSLDYGYSSSKLSSISLVGTSTTVGFDYTNGKLTKVRMPGYANHDHERADLSYGTGTATVTRYGRVDGSADDVAISQTHTFNANGTCASREEPHTSAETVTPWSFEYSPGNEGLRETTPMGFVSRRTVDAFGQVRDEYDEMGHHTSYEYDARGNVTREVDPRGAATVRTYDPANGNLRVEERDLNTAGQKSRVEYTYSSTKKGVVESKTQLLATPASGSECAVTLYDDFADNGEPRRTRDVGVKLSSSGASQTIETKRTFTAFGDVEDEYAPVTSGTGARTAHNVYSVSGRLLSSTDASGVVTSYEHDAPGNVTETWREKAPSAVKADWVRSTYDGLGRVVTEERRLSSETSWSVQSVTTHALDALGREVTTDDSVVAGLPAATSYDARGNVKASWAEGVADAGVTRAERTDYDADGRATAVYEPGATTPRTTSYYDDGSERYVVEPDGSRTDWEYDGAGNRTKETVKVGDGQEPDAITTYVYDLGGRSVKQTSPDPDNAVTVNEYDLADRRITTGMEGQDGSSSLTYNTLGWPLAEQDSDGIQTTRVYDPAGRVVSETTAGKTTTNHYDDLGRTDATCDPDLKRASFVYDVFGRVEQERIDTTSGNVRNTTRTFDSLGRVKTETQGSGMSTSLTYPAVSPGDSKAAITYGGMTTTVTVNTRGYETTRASAATGVSLTRSIDSRDTADRETQVSYGSSGQHFSKYDAAGHLIKQWGDGLSSAEPSDATPSYAYNADGRKTGDALAMAYGGSIANSYTYRTDGRLESATIGGATTSYTYDQSGSVKTATTGASTRTLSYDTQNRLSGISVTGATTKVVEFDAEYGWRERQGPSSNMNETVFDYTGTGRLKSYDTSAVSGVDGTYTYDAAGQRVRSVVRDAAGRTTTSEWAYGGLSLLRVSASRTDGQTWAITYLYDGAGRPYAGVYTGTDAPAPKTFRLLLTDRGDVVGLLDSAGTPFASYRYDAWGNPISTSSSPTADVTSTALAASIAGRQVLRYAGYVYDTESGFYYCSARHYDPTTMQFLSKDPLDADSEESAYHYCGGDPVGRVDRTGLVFTDYYRADERTPTTVATQKARVKHGWWGERRLTHCHVVIDIRPTASRRASVQNLQVAGMLLASGVEAASAYGLFAVVGVSFGSIVIGGPVGGIIGAVAVGATVLGSQVMTDSDFDVDLWVRAKLHYYHTSARRHYSGVTGRVDDISRSSWDSSRPTKYKLLRLRAPRYRQSYKTQVRAWASWLYKEHVRADTEHWGSKARGVKRTHKFKLPGA